MHVLLIDIARSVQTMKPHLIKLYNEAEEWSRNLRPFTCELSLLAEPEQGLDHRPVVAKYRMDMEEEFLEDLLNEDMGLLVTLRTKELGASGPHVHVWIVESEDYAVGFVDFDGSTAQKDFGCDFDPNRILDGYDIEDLEILAQELSYRLFEPALRRWISAYGDAAYQHNIDPFDVLPEDAAEDVGVIIATDAGHPLPSTAIMLSADLSGARLSLAKLGDNQPKIFKTSDQPFATISEMTAWLDVACRA